MLFELFFFYSLLFRVLVGVLCAKTSSFVFGHVFVVFLMFMAYNLESVNRRSVSTNYVEDERLLAVI